MKNILKIGLVTLFTASLTTAEARPNKDKEKPERPKPEKKIDREKIKERLKAAFEKRKKHHKDSKKKGHKLHHKGKAFGKLVRDDEKVKELRDSFAQAEMKLFGAVSPRISPLPEIRGVGNLLGVEQSGQMEVIGFMRKHL